MASKPSQTLPSPLARFQPDQALGQLHYQPRQPVVPESGCRRAWLAGLTHYVKWWLIFAGIYASSSVCPFCGKPGCPVGPGAASLVGVVFAWLMTFGRHLRQRLQTLLIQFRG